MWVVQYIHLHVITQNSISTNIYSGSVIVNSWAWGSKWKWYLWDNILESTSYTQPPKEHLSCSLWAGNTTILGTGREASIGSPLTILFPSSKRKSNLGAHCWAIPSNPTPFSPAAWAERPADLPAGHQQQSAPRLLLCSAHAPGHTSEHQQSWAGAQTCSYITQPIVDSTAMPDSTFLGWSNYVVLFCWPSPPTDKPQRHHQWQNWCEARGMPWQCMSLLINSFLFLHTTL